MTIAIISHPDCLLHKAHDAHPESPERLRAIEEGIKHYSFSKPVKRYTAPLATWEQLVAVHDEDYLRWIQSIAPPKKEVIAIDADTYMNHNTWQAALRAAGSVPAAIDLLQKGEAQVAFCNVRPPGHHAEPDKAMGFCIFNNVAIGVKYAMQHHGLERIAIIDFDAHRGNGTQVVFQNNRHVLYCSSFQYPFYPGYESERDNSHILSVPLRAGTGGELFRVKVKEAWFDKINQFKPQMIFFSAGFDGHVDDSISNLCLTESDYVWLTLHIARMAKVHCQGKIVSVLEGGYNLKALEECVPAHINALLGMHPEKGLEL